MRQRVSGLGLAVCSLLASCNLHYERVATPYPHVLPDASKVTAAVAALSKEAERACKPWLLPRIHCDEQPYLCRRIPGLDVQVGDRTLEELESVLSFVHLSDAQLKDQGVRMSVFPSERIFDGVVPGVDRDPKLEAYDFATLLATVLGINELLEAGKKTLRAGSGTFYQPLPPAFVVHTGDAVDSGLRRELAEFLAIMQRLDAPFFSAVGNHDNLFFGTFPPPRVRAPEWASLRSTKDFVREHDATASVVSRGFHEPTLYGLPRPIFADARYPAGGTWPLPSSQANGFDLYKPKANEPAMPGYYSVPIDLPDSRVARRYCPNQDVADHTKRRIVLIVLNTAAVQPRNFLQGIFVRKSAGELDKAQFQWLSDELDAKMDRCTWFLVAGHHPVNSFIGTQRDKFYERLVKNGRVLAYFAGHTHRNSIRRHPEDARKPPMLWEVVGGSTLIHPQFGLLVDLLHDEDAPDSNTDLAFLRVRSFRQRLGDRNRDCGALSAYAAAGVRGSDADQVDGDWTDEDVAIHRANGLIPLWLH